jgi:O-methyltransferase
MTVPHQAAKSVAADMEPAFAAIWEAVRPFTMTSVERVYSLWQATRYVCRRPVAGAFVECGVWRGGSVLAMAMTLLNEGVSDRDFYLFDTFEGMPAPGAEDVDAAGRPATSLLGAETKSLSSEMWAWAPEQHVRGNLAKVQYPSERFNLVRGKVEDTIPRVLPERIALLRLDTDFYESTVHELRWLYPNLSPGGVLIIDDYGHWRGARKAVDEFLQSHPELMLMRIDYTGRIAVKPTA